MEKTIEQLFEIEEKANQIINRATEEKALLHDNFEKEITLLEQSIASENKMKLKALQEQADINLANEMKVLISDSEKHLRELDDINDNKHDFFVNQIFEAIIHS